MEVHLINDGAEDNFDFLTKIVEMQVIPRKGETITFPVTEGGKSYIITGVDYLIKEKKQGTIRVWVKLLI